MNTKEITIEQTKSDTNRFSIICKIPLGYADDTKSAFTATTKFNECPDKEFWIYVSELAKAKAEQC